MRGMLRLVGRLAWVVVVLAFMLVAVNATRVVLTARSDERRASDVIVVLGAAQFDGEPGPVLLARLEHAKTLRAEGVAPVVMTTGGSRAGDRFTEGGSGLSWLRDQGLPEEDLVAIEEGSDTLSSLQATAVVMQDRGWDSAVVVTDPSHLLRSVTMLEDQGVDAVGSPAPSTPGSGSVWQTVKYTARETLGLTYHQARQLFP